MGNQKGRSGLRVIRGVAALSFVVAVGSGACGARTGLHATECVELDAALSPANLVIFSMLDRSGSMAFETEGGSTKAEAVRASLANFFSDPASAGTYASAAFFPILNQSVPRFCGSDADCGLPGACAVESRRLCYPSLESLCETAADCPGENDGCYELGVCKSDADLFCLPELGAQGGCAFDDVCQVWATCLNQSYCDVSEYAKPVVPVGVLPQVGGALIDAAYAQEPDGSTPTLPALQGGLSAARSWQDSHPTDKAVVLLSTDGLPTTCDPAIKTLFAETTEGVPAVAAAAAQGFGDGVQTFVLGVFSPDEEEMATFALGEIASAGGSSAAFIVTTDEDVTPKLVSALGEIRERARRCEYPIPWPSNGSVDPLDLQVFLGAAAPDGGAGLVRVATAAHCDPVTGGFHFDRDPKPGVLPHRVVLCPASCGKPGEPPPAGVRLRGGCHIVSG